MLKYTDRDGDAVTLTNRTDVRAAVADAVAAAAAPKGGLAPMAPSMKITCVPCGEVRWSRAPACPLPQGAHADKYAVRQSIRRQLQQLPARGECPRRQSSPARPCVVR
jgi:hypothetical protein